MGSPSRAAMKRSLNTSLSPTHYYEERWHQGYSNFSLSKQRGCSQWHSILTATVVPQVWSIGIPCPKLCFTWCVCRILTPVHLCFKMDTISTWEMLLSHFQTFSASSTSHPPIHSHSGQTRPIILTLLSIIVTTSGKPPRTLPRSRKLKARSVSFTVVAYTVGKQVESWTDQRGLNSYIT